MDGSVAVVLTSWKNLGYGKALDDPFWKSHLGGGPDRSPVGLHGSIGTVYTAFEGPFLPYVPQLFTVIFHACTPMITHDYVAEFVLRPRQDISWTPLCSHLSLGEAIRGGIEFTPEQLEVIVAVRKTRAKEVSNQNSISHRANRRAEDEDAYKAKVTSDKKRWPAKNLDKVNKTAGKVRQKNISSRRFHFDDCDMSLQSQLALDDHLTTQRHADILDGTECWDLNSSGRLI